MGKDEEGYGGIEEGEPGVGKEGRIGMERVG